MLASSLQFVLIYRLSGSTLVAASHQESAYLNFFVLQRHSTRFLSSSVVLSSKFSDAIAGA